MRAAVRLEIRHEKARGRFLRRGLDGCDDGYTPVICPTSQIVSRADRFTVAITGWSTIEKPAAVLRAAG
jgi:hypothetical protein